MSIYTFSVDFGTGPHPAISKHTDILGGTLQAVQFSDALAELETVTEQRDDLLEALRRSVIALAFAAETSPAMRDDYEAVSAAIAKATGEKS
jgi:hypothetical protein